MNSEVQAKRAAMVHGGETIAKVVRELKPLFIPGVKTIDIDTRARELIVAAGVEVSFDKVPGYRHATCISVNEGVVHGVPNEYRLKEGDVVKLDIGAFYKGYHVDYGDTYVIGATTAHIERFLSVGRSTLSHIINAAGNGVRVGELSSIIEKAIYGAGYKVLVTLTGHGVGTELHMDPYIPGVLDRPINKTPRLKAGNAYALEVIYSMNDEEVTYLNKDGWSLKTATNSMSACFENSVFIDEKSTEVLVKGV